MPESTKNKFYPDDIIWYYPFPKDSIQLLRDTRYKAVVLDAIDDLYYDYSIYIIEEGHPNPRKKARVINMVEYNGE